MDRENLLDLKVKMVSEREYVNLLEREYRKILHSLKTDYPKEYKKFMDIVSEKATRFNWEYEGIFNYLNENSLIIPSELRNLYRALLFYEEEFSFYNFTVGVIKSELIGKFSEEFKEKVRKLFDILITAKDYLIPNLPSLKYCMIRIDDTVYISMEYARKELIHFVVNTAESLKESNIKDPLNKIMSEITMKKVAMVYPTATIDLKEEKLKNPEQYPFYFVENLGIEDSYELFKKFYYEGIMPRIIKKFLYFNNKQQFKRVLSFLNKEKTLYAVVMRHFILQSNKVLMETKFTYLELKELGITDEEIILYQIGGHPGNEVMAKVLSHIERDKKGFQKTLIYTLMQKTGYTNFRKIYNVSAVSGNKRILKYIENYVPHSLLSGKVYKLQNPQDLAFAVVLYAVQESVVDKKEGLSILDKKGKIIQKGYDNLYPELKEKFVKGVIRILDSKGIAVDKKALVIEKNAELFRDIFADYKANFSEPVKKDLFSLTDSALLKIIPALNKGQIADLWNYAVTNGTESKAVLLSKALNSNSGTGKKKKVKLTI